MAPHNGAQDPLEGFSDAISVPLLRVLTSPKDEIGYDGSSVAAEEGLTESWGTSVFPESQISYQATSGVIPCFGRS